MSRRLGRLLVALSTVAACRPESTTWVPAVLDDAAVATADFEAPVLRFDGRGGSLFAADGWTRHRSTPDGTTTAISRGERSLLLFPPQGGPRDLLLSCRSVPSAPGGAPRVRLFQGGLERSSAIVSTEWTEIRLSFGGADLGHGIQTAELRFSAPDGAAAPPSAAGREARWARCRAAAVVPPGAPLPPRRTSTDAPAVLSVPVPPHSRGEVEIEAPPSAEARDLTARLRSRSGELRELRLVRQTGTESWRGTFDNDAAEPAEIRLGPGPGAITAARDLRTARSTSIRWAALGGASSPTPAPNIFVYVVDTLRTDSVLDALSGDLVSRDLVHFGRDAVTFEQAWSPSSWTLPAMASLLTGQSPHQHGVEDGSSRLAPQGAPTLAERLGAAGYQTLGLSQSWVVSGRFGLDRGFDRFLLADQLNGAEHRAQDLRGQLRQWLVHEARFDRPMLVLLHTVEPHGPYTSPHAADDSRRADGDESMAPLRRRDAASDADAVRRWRGRYEAEASLAQEQFARFLALLRGLGLYQRSAILLVSDHGEEFGEHGGFEHGRTLRSEQTRVPALLKLPDGELAGLRVRAPISTLDLVATLADLAGQAPQGRVEESLSLLPDLRRGSPRPRPIELSLAVEPSEAYERARLESLVLDEIQCEFNLDSTDRWGDPVPAWTFWRLSSAIGLERSLDASSPHARACRELLEKRLEARATEPFRAPPIVGEEERARLKALGYIR